MGRSGKVSFASARVEQFIAEQLDGRKRPSTRCGSRRKGTVSRARSHPRRSPPSSPSCRKNGPPRGPGCTGVRSLPSPVDLGALLGSLLYMRIPLFDPKPAVRSVGAPACGSAFTAANLWWLFGGVSCSWPHSSPVLQWSDVRQGPVAASIVSRRFRCFLLVHVRAGLFAHEAAPRPLTCKRFRGRGARGSGSCSSTSRPDSTPNVKRRLALFPKKVKAAVGWSGPDRTSSCFLWALATLTWRVTDVDTRIKLRRADRHDDVRHQGPSST